MEWRSLRQQAPYQVVYRHLSFQECCSRGSWAQEVVVVNMNVPFKLEASITEFLSEGLWKLVLLSKKYWVLTMGQFPFKCFIWMSSSLCKRDCYPEIIDEEIELYLRAYKWWDQHLNPSSLLQRMYFQLPWIHEFYSEKITTVEEGF